MTNQDLPPKIVREMYRCFTLDNLLENAHQPNDLISETVLIQYVGKWLQTNITLKQTIQYHGTAVPSREIYNTHGKIVWYLPQSNSFLVKGKSPQEYEEYSASQILHVLNYSTIASNFQAWLGECFWDFLMHHYRSFSKSKPDHEMKLKVIIDKITPVMCDEISQNFFPFIGNWAQKQNVINLFKRLRLSRKGLIVFP